MKYGSLARGSSARRAGLLGFALLMGLCFAGLSTSGDAHEALAAPTPPGDAIGAELPRGASGGLTSQGAVATSEQGGTALSSAEVAPLRREGEPTEPPARRWQLVRGRHWQIVGPPGEPTELTDVREDNRGACAPGMIEVAGNMKRHALLDELQLQSCTDWIERKWPARCAAYDRDQWLALSEGVPTKEMRFCIDRFEYPNQKGQYPIILVSFHEAHDACSAEGKRLCTEDEWTFACEGEEATPYPNGYVRDPEACVEDRPWRKFDTRALRPRDGERARREVDRLWQGVASGTRPLCKSSFGVYDMTGNIDEWTRSSVAGERPSVLKGGYWGRVRARCRPATKAHGETHTFYQQGFRCCADAP